MLHVVVDPPEAVGRVPGAPHQAVEESRHQCLGLLDQDCDDVLVRVEQGVDAVVVPLSVRADGQEVDDDRLGRIQGARLDRPHQRRDRMRADLDVQHPQRTLATGRAADRLLQHLSAVGVDGLHHDCRALVDHARQDPRDQAQRPAEGLLRTIVFREHADDLHPSRHEGAEQFRRDAVANVTQAERRYVFDHLVRLLVDVQGHGDHLVRDPVQASRRLLEELLAGWRQRKELRVDLAANEAEPVFVQAAEKLSELLLLNRGLAPERLDHPRDILPEPRPRHLMLRAPVLDQGAQ
mmetsp:Transcript_152113/g.486020  ORF Transcript_152113/g.486020 Transcript_152113/m.486020 type:complete len:294 (-) Transcript_152113:569-1450(-)